ncbi:hypothetical protein ACLUU9_09065 (plasmid) [Rothia mucilaginosa]|uniref:hypothetical protein n=1 Tax=Rothia mucilaginosa TaxID=43675 RepID=UPI0039A1A66F
MHEIFDELESQSENRSPRPDPRQRGRGRGSGPKRGRGALIALLLTFVVVVCFVIMQPRGGNQPTAAPSPSLAAPQGALEASPSATSEYSLGANPNAVEARPSAKASVVPIAAPERQNPDRSNPDDVMRAWAVTWSWRESANDTARVVEWSEPFSDVVMTDAFATKDPVVGVQAPFMVTHTEVLPRSKNQGIDTSFRKSRVVKVTVKDHRDVQVTLTWELTTLEDTSGQWMVTDASMTSWEGAAR